MRAMVLCQTAFLLLLAAPTASAAGDDSSPGSLTSDSAIFGLYPGDRVRLRTSDRPHRRIETVYAGVRADTLLLRAESLTEATVPVPLSRVALLERPAGKRRHVGAGIGIGLLVGSGVGALIGSQTAKSDEWFGPMHVAVGLVAGGVGGIILGGIVGATVRTDRWVPVERASKDKYKD